jgi:hypothetical protein
MSSFKTKTALGIKPMVLPDDADVSIVRIDIPLDAAENTNGALGVSDVITVCELPPTVKVNDYTLFVDDIDTGTTAVFDFGELDAAGTAIATAYVTGSTVGQAGGVARASTLAHLNAVTNTTRRLGIKFTGAQAGSLAGKKITLLLDLNA